MINSSFINFSDTHKILYGIKASDFLVSDKKCVHRLVGFRYDAKTMCEPEVTVICVRCQMAYAKHIAFSLGKKIYQNSDLSASIFRNYYGGQKIRCQDYNEVAKIYADYMAVERK